MIGGRNRKTGKQGNRETADDPSPQSGACPASSFKTHTEQSRALRYEREQ